VARRTGSNGANAKQLLTITGKCGLGGAHVSKQSTYETIARPPPGIAFSRGQSVSKVRIENDCLAQTA
jgi:hypothetical protein